MRVWAVTVSVLILVVAGCSDTVGDSTDTGTSPPDSSPTTTEVPEPPTEPTTTETTQTRRKEPSISIVSAPIGGDVKADGVNQCAEVNWLGRNPIPDGTSIAAGTPSLDPDNVFEFDQSACVGAARSCTGVRWRTNPPAPCWVGVHQVANADKEVTLVIPVEATCATQPDCDSLARGKGTSQIHFEPTELETTPTETPDDTQTTTEPPTETPSDG